VTWRQEQTRSSEEIEERAEKAEEEAKQLRRKVEALEVWDGAGCLARDVPRCRYRKSLG